jgi:superoxide dismutase
MTHQLPPLPYAYNGLEPYISEQIMVLHHTKHHQGYINALNTAEASYAKTSTPKERIALQSALKFNLIYSTRQATSITRFSGRTWLLPRRKAVTVVN